MAEWLSIPRLIDLILLGMACEALWLHNRHRQQGHCRVPHVMLHLLSGALLLIAMRLALSDVPPLLTAAVLGFAGLFHAIDIRKALFSHR
jgi:hypothetical protein